MTDGAIVGREMTPMERVLSRAQTILVRLSRKLPRLVWYNDEVDVTVTFTADKLPVGLEFDPADPKAGERVMRELFSGPVSEIEKQMARLGIGFDKGMGCEGRDWEWDWSLSGPISVRFRSRAKKPERRAGSAGLKATDGSKG